MSQFKQNVRMQLPEATMVIMPFIKEAMDWWMANIPLKPMTSVQLWICPKGDAMWFLEAPKTLKYFLWKSLIPINENQIIHHPWRMDLFIFIWQGAIRLFI